MGGYEAYRFCDTRMGSASRQGRRLTVENMWVSDSGEGPLCWYRIQVEPTRAPWRWCARSFLVTVSCWLTALGTDARPTSSGRGSSDHWAVVVRNAVELHQLEPNLSLARLSDVKAPVLIIVGDDDEVQFGHLLEMYGALPNAELAVVPRSTHGLIIEKPDILARFARDLHRSDRTNGVAPLRRT